MLSTGLPGCGARPAVRRHPAELEHLVLRDELPAEARGVYDRAVMQLGRDGT